MARSVAYLSWTPSFAEQLFVATLVVRAAKKGWAVVTSERTFARLSQAQRYCEEFAEGLAKEGMKMEYGLITQLGLKRLWTMKENYWEATQSMDFADIRQRLFQTMLEKFEPGNWSVVVTPAVNPKDGMWAGMPVENERLEKDIEAFMRYSDWPVNPETTHSGIYAAEDILRVDLVPRRARKVAKK